MSSALIRTFGWPMPLLHSDTAVLDRWLWLRRRLPRADGSKRLIDVGCGSGAFTIGAALRGYRALGLSWDERNQNVASERAQMCKANLAEFDVQDIRQLHTRKNLIEQFDVAVCCEVIEHVFDDAKLMRNIADCLLPGGRLLLTTPNFHLKPIDPSHAGPFPTVEDGGHVRKGYTRDELLRLSEQAGLVADGISYCTGFLSQKITLLHFLTKRIHPVVAWGVVNPFRIFPPMLDPILTEKIGYPYYSICLEAHKPAR